MSGQHRQQGIVPQLLVVVEVLVAQTHGKDPLLEQLLDRELDQLRVAKVVETGGEAAENVRAGLDFPQEQGPRVGSNRAAVKAGRDFPTGEGLKIKRRSVTLCSHKPPC